MNFTIKTFTLTGTYKQTINPRIVKNDIQFTSTINGGLGELALRLDIPISDTSIEQGDQIKVWDGLTLIYGGFIDEVDYKASSVEELEIRATGYHSLFTRLLYNEVGNYQLTKNGTPASIIADIVTYLNTKYNVFTDESENGSDSVSYEVDYSNIKDILDDMKDLSEDRYWYVNEEGHLIYRQKPTIATSRITYKKNIFSLEVQEDTKDLVNTLHLERDGGTIKTYTDSTSISSYGVRENYISNSSLTDETTQDSYGDEYIEQNKEPKKRVSLTVTNEDGVTLTPGEKVKILNIDKDFGNLLITKKTYNKERIVLELEEYDNVISLIKT